MGTIKNWAEIKLFVCMEMFHFFLPHHVVLGRRFDFQCGIITLERAIGFLCVV